MTEDELREAVHEYADCYCQSQFDQVTNAEMPRYMAPAWAKLLEAVRKFAGDEAVREVLMERSYDLLSAKAAVCDAVLADIACSAGARELSDAASAAVAALSKLEAKKP